MSLKRTGVGGAAVVVVGTGDDGGLGSVAAVPAHPVPAAPLAVLQAQGGSSVR